MYCPSCPSFKSIRKNSVPKTVKFSKSQIFAGCLHSRYRDNVIVNGRLPSAGGGRTMKNHCQAYQEWCNIEKSPFRYLSYFFFILSLFSPRGKNSNYKKNLNSTVLQMSNFSHRSRFWINKKLYWNSSTKMCSLKMKLTCSGIFIIYGRA